MQHRRIPSSALLSRDDCDCSDEYTSKTYIIKLLSRRIGIYLGYIGAGALGIRYCKGSTNPSFTKIEPID
jgi:hypothetical protein